jgi:hypothetical protein
MSESLIVAERNCHHHHRRINSKRAERDNSGAAKARFANQRTWMNGDFYEQAWREQKVCLLELRNSEK